MVRGRSVGLSSTTDATRDAIDGSIAALRMKPSDPDFRAKVRHIFDAAPFIQDLGITLGDVGDGFCESHLVLAPRHMQQDGFVHAGVVATMADHTAGAAGGTLVRKDQTILTIEFKINLLRPTVGESLRCRGSVLRGGRSISVVESEVFAQRASGESLVAKATVTLAVVDANVGRRA